MWVDTPGVIDIMGDETWSFWLQQTGGSESTNESKIVQVYAYTNKKNSRC